MNKLTFTEPFQTPRPLIGDVPLRVSFLKIQSVLTAIHIDPDCNHYTALIADKYPINQDSEILGLV